MAKVLLDTDILSEYLKGHDKVVASRAAAYVREHGKFTFTSVTVHEIVFGLEFKGASAQLQKALRWLGQNEEIIPSAGDYLEAAMIKCGGAKAGSNRRAGGLPDCRRGDSIGPASGDGEHQ